MRYDGPPAGPFVPNEAGDPGNVGKIVIFARRVCPRFFTTFRWSIVGQDGVSDEQPLYPSLNAVLPNVDSSRLSTSGPGPIA
jgi:hypothetical protein